MLRRVFASAFFTFKGSHLKFYNTSCIYISKLGDRSFMARSYYNIITTAEWACFRGIFPCGNLHDFIFDAFREVHILKRSKILYGQESEGLYIPLFIRTVRATFTAHGSSPKDSVSCRHASFRFILSNVPPRVSCCHSSLYRKKRSSFKVYSFYIFPVAPSSN